MKKYLLPILLLLIPSLVFGAVAVPWATSNISNGFISPGLVNGVLQGVGVYASSTIGDGTSPGGLTISGNGTTTLNHTVSSLDILSGTKRWELNLSGNDLNVAELGSGNGRIYIKAGGNVGISTTNPLVKLQVTQPADTNYPTLGVTKGATFVSGDTGTYGMYTGINTNSGNAWMQSMRNDGPTAYNILLQPAGGNVGIGAVAPNTKLEIDGLPVSGGTYPFNILSIDTATTFAANIGGGIGFGGLSDGSSQSYWSAIHGGKSNGTSGNYSGNLQFYTRNNGDTSLTERMRIDNLGNVGIGTTTPYSTLSVSAPSQQAGTLPLFTVASTTAASLFTVLGSGKVGIGIANPANLFQVNSSPGFIAFAQAGNNIFGNGCHADGVSADDACAHGQYYVVNGTGGRIVTQILGAPSQSADYLDISANGGATGGILSVSSTGNLGVGVVSPASKLDVAGTINTDQYSGFSQNSSMLLTASSTTRNTLGGFFAGQNLLTTTSLTGNTAFGFNAMKNATSSWNITAIGSGALANLSDCETPTGPSHCSMTAVGTNALASNTTGFWNTALGSGSLLSNTTGAQNNSFGTNALSGNTTGVGNQAFGFGAMSANVTGSSNTAIGGQAIQRSLSSGNIAIGQYAGLFQTTGGNNTFLGTQSGMSNVGVSNSDTNSVIDTNMVFLGVNAARDANGIASTTVMTNSMALGANSRVGASNSVAIGGLGSNAVNVGIGSSTPSAQLAVHANAGSTNTTLFAIASSTATATTTLFKVSNIGEVTHGGGTPVISACGTTPNGSVVGNDNLGTVTVGGGVVTDCTITYASAKVGTPKAFLQVEGGTSIGVSISSSSSTGFTAHFAGSIGSGVFHYYVISY